MKIKSIKFLNSVRVGSKQDLYFTSDLFNIVLKDQFVIADDYKGGVTHIPLSNVGWFTPEPTKPEPTKTVKGSAN